MKNLIIGALVAVAGVAFAGTTPVANIPAPAPTKTQKTVAGKKVVAMKTETKAAAKTEVKAAEPKTENAKAVLPKTEEKKEMKKDEVAPTVAPAKK